MYKLNILGKIKNWLGKEEEMKSESVPYPEKYAFKVPTKYIIRTEKVERTLSILDIENNEENRIRIANILGGAKAEKLDSKIKESTLELTEQEIEEYIEENVEVDELDNKE